MFKKILGLGILLCLISLAYAQEEKITITTYYPSPYGSYRELRSQRMAIGDAYIQGGDYCWPEETCTNQIYSDLNGSGSFNSGEDLVDLVVQGNVGIGTTNPASNLHIQKGNGVADVIDSNAVVELESNTNAANFWFNAPTAATGGTNATLGFATNGAVQHGITYNITNDYLAITPEGTLAAPTSGLIVANSGNVGIGTAAPGATLEVTSASGTWDSANPYRADITLASDHGNRHDSSIMFWSAGSAGRILYNGDQFYFSTWNQNATSGAQARISTTSGTPTYFLNNIGIGTTNPNPSKGSAGYVDANDVWLRDAKNGAGAWASEAGGVGFGAWETKSADTNYQAQTDGFVVAYGSKRGIIGYTDSSPNPSTIRAWDSAGQFTTGLKCSITMPVRKGDYWRVTKSSSDGLIYTIYWISLGS